MSKLKIKDFEGLNVSPFAEKVSKITDMSFLSELENYESDNGNRVGVLNAINRRQGELLDEEREATKDEPSNKEADTIADDEQPGGGNLMKNLIELAVEEFKATLQDIGNKEDLEDILRAVREQSNDPAIEQIVIERLAEVTGGVSGPIGEKGEPGTDGIRDDQGTPGDDYGKGGLGDRPMTDEESQAAAKAPVSESNAPAAETMEDRVEYLKATRLELDKALQFSKDHRRIGDDCNENIFLTKAWLGKMLGAYGTKNPYDVKVVTATDIPPTAEKNEGAEFQIARRNFTNLNPVQAVLELRDMLDWVIKRLDRLDPQTWEQSVIRTQAWVNASEARFKLGEELSKLRK